MKRRVFRALVLLVGLMIVPGVARADPLERDPDWGSDGAVYLEPGRVPVAMFADPDGTLWVLGNVPYPLVLEPFLVEISEDGSTMTDVPLDLPDGAEIYRAARTDDGFALALYVGSDFATAKIADDGALDIDFGVVTLGPARRQHVSALLPWGRDLIVAGSIVTEASGFVPVAMVARYQSDGSLDPTFADGGLFTVPHECASTAVVLFRGVGSFETVVESCDSLSVSDPTVFTLDLDGAVVDVWTQDVAFIGEDDFAGVQLPDGRKVMSRVGQQGDFSEARLQALVIDGRTIVDRIVDAPGLPIGSTVAVADRAGSAWAFAASGLHTLVVEVTGPDVAPFITDESLVVTAAATDWLTGSMYLGWSNGRITRTSADGSGRFTDDDDSVHVGDIEDLAMSETTRGCNPPLGTWFCPDEQMTRGEMAALLVRALDLPDGDAGFTDTSDSVFAGDIDALAAAGITTGCAPGLFCPDDPVTRGQMAAFLTRALNLDPGPDAFDDDDGSVFEADIDALAAAGITVGCTPDAFCPEDPVTRAQMASFLVRAGAAG